MMPETTWIIGVDPGESVGITALVYLRGDKDTPWMRQGNPIIIQCHHLSTRFLLSMLIHYAKGSPVIISHERFVVGLRASKSRKSGASQVTRDLNGAIGELADGRTNVRVVEHTAAQVKTWATAEKMAAAGLVLPPEMRHATDGGRQALFCATHDLGAPDPLSKRSGQIVVTCPPETQPDRRPQFDPKLHPGTYTDAPDNGNPLTVTNYIVQMDSGNKFATEYFDAREEQS